jgi:hypothetical protein
MQGVDWLGVTIGWNKIGPIPLDNEVQGSVW